MAEGSLDYRTLFLVSGIVGTALLLLLAMQARKPYPGFVRVLLALSVVSAAVIIADLRGFAPDALLSIQLTALVGFAAIDSGVRRFSGAPRRGRWPYIYVLAAIFLQIYSYFARPLHQRIILTSLLSIPIFVDTALPLLGNRPEGHRFGYRFTASVSILGCFAASLRIMAVLSFGRTDSPYFSVNPADTAFFITVLFLLLGMAFGFITLAHERLVAELKAANRNFRLESEERARVEARLVQSERLATIGRLEGGVAHFFNNQMQIIQLSCSVIRQSLQRFNLPPLATIEEIEKASRRSADITSRLLQYAQSRTLRTSRFNPKELLNGLIPELRIAAGDKIKVNTSSPSEVPVVELDAAVLKETILVLVRNAKDAMPSGGTLTISLRETVLDSCRAKELDLSPSAFVALSVADTGSGMDDQTLALVFEPFFTTKSKATVEGLGLASAYGFLRQSGGTITVSSAPSRGSIFELYLPTAAQAIPSEVVARGIGSRAGC